METIEQIKTTWSDRSESIVKLAGALSKFQGQLEAVKKDSSNPFFKSKYADLSNVWDAIRPHLAKNGLSIIQEPGSASGKVLLTTTLIHESGEYTRSTIEMPVVKQDPQGYGSAITYARRYSLQSVTGIAPEDDDGNAASQQKAPQTQAKPQVKKPATWTGEDTIKGGEHDGTKWKDVPADWLEGKRYSASPAAKALIEAEINRRDEEAFDREYNNTKGAA